MKSKKILYVGSYYPTLGGAEKYLYDLALNRKNSAILCPNVIGDSPKDPCKIIRAKTLIKNPAWIKKNPFLEYVQNYSFVLPAISKGKKIIENENIDIIHAQFGLSFGIIGYFLKKKTGKPLILTLHGSGFNFRSWRKIFKPITRRVLLSADKIIAVSNAILNEAKQIANIQGEVIYNSVSLEEFKNKGNKKYILAVGRLAKMKGFNILIQAAKELPNYNFIIIGEGPERKILEEIISKENIKNVSLLGQKTSSETKNYMENCSIFVMPSLYGEGLPFALVEAISSGKAVIGTNVRGIPEVINKNGLLIEPGNVEILKKSITDLVENNRKRKKMEKESLEFAKKNFNLKKNLKRLEEEYNKA